MTTTTIGHVGDDFREAHEAMSCWRDDVRRRTDLVFSEFEIGPSTYFVMDVSGERMISRIVVVSCSCGLWCGGIWLDPVDDLQASTKYAPCPTGPCLIPYFGRWTVAIEGQTFVETTCRWLRLDPRTCPRREPE